MYSAPLRTVLFGKKTNPDLYLDFTLGQLDPRITYTHTNANSWGFNAAGVLVNYAATTPKFDYGVLGGGACRGLRIEAGPANSLLWCRDGTNAAWTKSGSMTATKDVTGLDGVVNSATRLTAGASDQTILQSITLGASTRATSFYLKRITGTGTVEITDDGGGNWIDVTAAIAAGGAGWSRHYNARNQSNPNVGIRIRTSGDEVAFDCGQVEVDAYPSSPIITTSSAVTRVRDDATMTGTNFSDWFNGAAGTFLAEFYVDYAPTAVFDRTLLQVDDGNVVNNRLTAFAARQTISSRAGIAIYNAGSSQGDFAAVVTMSAGILQRHASSYSASGFNLACNGVLGTRDASVSLPSWNRLIMGGRIGSGAQFNGVLKSLSYWRSESTDGRLITLSSL